MGPLRKSRCKTLYLADGTKLPPNYPMPIHPGSRFYLGSSKNLFELVALH